MIKKICSLLFVASLYGSEQVTIMTSNEVAACDSWKNKEFNICVKSYSPSPTIHYIDSDDTTLSFGAYELEGRNSLATVQNRNFIFKTAHFLPTVRGPISHSHDKYFGVFFDKKSNDEQSIYSYYKKEWPDPLANKKHLLDMVKEFYDHVTYPYTSLSKEILAEQPYVKTIYDAAARQKDDDFFNNASSMYENRTENRSWWLWYVVNVPHIRSKIVPKIIAYCGEREKSNGHDWCNVVVDYGKERIVISGRELFIRVGHVAKKITSPRIRKEAFDTEEQSHNASKLLIEDLCESCVYPSWNCEGNVQHTQEFYQ
jgi:predicted ribosome-associated RNA-binding protein Tma20